jgi:crotonobetaine/carnitine-CoA ligase
MIGNLLEERAALHPARTFGRFHDGAEITSWTWAEANLNISKTASALAALGIRERSVVGIALPNSAFYVAIIFGASRLGAVITGINPSLTSDGLHHVVGTARPQLLICDEKIAELLAPEYAEVGEVEGFGVKSIVVARREEAAIDHVGLVRLEEMNCTAHHVISPRADAEFAITFTSGTTGRSKGVLSSYAQLDAQVRQSLIPVTTAADTWLVDLPLFHVGGLMGLYMPLVTGCSLATVPRISVSNYWKWIDQLSVTHAFVLPSVARMLLSAPESRADSQHNLDFAFMAPVIGDIGVWQRRFGVHRTGTGYNSTEISAPIHRLDVPADDYRWSGKVREGVEIRLVDENNVDVPDGTRGRMLVRTRDRAELNLGYVGMPEETAEAWLDGWFRTGDAFQRDAEGRYFFVGRVNDFIRRRGENISAFEVETELLRYPGIRDCAVFGVPSPLEDEEVKAVLVTDQIGFDVADLAGFLRARLPGFMVPRFVELIAELPKTVTGRADKTALRALGDGGTWDLSSHP